MRVRTCLVLMWGVYTQLFLCWVFVKLFLEGEMVVEVVIQEHIQLIAGGEVLLTLFFAGLGLERLLALRERR